MTGTARLGGVADPSSGTPVTIPEISEARSEPIVDRRGEEISRNRSSASKSGSLDEGIAGNGAGPSAACASTSSSPVAGRCARPRASESVAAASRRDARTSRASARRRATIPIGRSRACSGAIEAKRVPSASANDWSARRRCSGEGRPTAGMRSGPRRRPRASPPGRMRRRRREGPWRPREEDPPRGRPVCARADERWSPGGGLSRMGPGRLMERERRSVPESETRNDLRDRRRDAAGRITTDLPNRSERRRSTRLARVEGAGSIVDPPPSPARNASARGTEAGSEQVFEQRSGPLEHLPGASETRRTGRTIARARSPRPDRLRKATRPPSPSWRASVDSLGRAGRSRGREASSAILRIRSSASSRASSHARARRPARSPDRAAERSGQAGPSSRVKAGDGAPGGALAR